MPPKLHRSLGRPYRQCYAESGYRNETETTSERASNRNRGGEREKRQQQQLPSKQAPPPGSQPASTRLLCAPQREASRPSSANPAASSSTSLAPFFCFVYTFFVFFFPSFLFSRPCLQFETSGSAQKRAGGDPTLRGYSSVCRNGGRPLQSSPAVAGGLSASAFPLRLTLSPSTQAVPRATLGLCKTLPLFSSTTAALNYPVSVETGSEVGTTLQEHCKMRLTKHVLGAGP